MSKQVQFRRGNSAEHKNFTGANGEVTVDTDLKTLRVHDGVTAGGSVLARTGDMPTPAQMSHNSSLSNDVIHLNLAADTRWTAPNDGHIFICGTSTGSNQGLWLALRTSADTALGYDDAFSTAAKQKLTVHVPISANQKFFYSVASGLTDISITYVKTRGDN